MNSQIFISMKFIEILNEMVSHPFPNSKKITFKTKDGEEIKVECEHAITPEEKITGVLGLEEMGDFNGVLFKGVSPTYYHMNGVKFPLDMVFCDNDKILDISYAEPDGENIYPPKGAIYNIELNGGFCDKHNIKKGDNFYMS